MTFNDVLLILLFVGPNVPDLLSIESFEDESGKVPVHHIDLQLEVELVSPETLNGLVANHLLLFLLSLLLAFFVLLRSRWLGFLFVLFIEGNALHLYFWTIRIEIGLVEVLRHFEDDGLLFQLIVVVFEGLSINQLLLEELEPDPVDSIAYLGEHGFQERLELENHLHLDVQLGRVEHLLFQIGKRFNFEVPFEDVLKRLGILEDYGLSLNVQVYVENKKHIPFLLPSFDLFGSKEFRTKLPHIIFADHNHYFVPRGNESVFSDGHSSALGLRTLLTGFRIGQDVLNQFVLECGEGVVVVAVYFPLYCDLDFLGVVRNQFFFHFIFSFFLFSF